jgi:hypothetical protein
MAAWSTETSRSRKVVAGRRGIRFADEQPADRSKGVLWATKKVAPRVGRPEYATVHPQRQRWAMQQQLCQVCGKPASRTALGTLWLVEDHHSDWSGWPERMITVHPPLCLPCACKAVEECPHLLDTGWAAVRVRASEVCGVMGTAYQPVPGGGAQPLPGKRYAEYGSRTIRWVLAGQLTRSLHGCTVVDLEAEAEASDP